MKYDVICPKCNKKAEIECKMSDYDKIIPYLACEECGSPMKRLLSAPSFVGEIGGYDSVGGKAGWQN